MHKKKLIEVALPLEAINEASIKENEPFTKNHPRSIHPWWARRSQATCRAVVFASLVDDPSAHTDKFPTEEAQEEERQRLFKLIEQLVKWENSNNERILEEARDNIIKSIGNNPISIYDPFCGRGSIPLEAQRLGLIAVGSDLNPVAVMIAKALIEIPQKFSGQTPVNPEEQRKFGKDEGWKGSSGLADDIRYYGQWMRDEAEKRIGHHYPKVKLPAEQGGGEATIIAWLWARTVKCPNPACGCEMPLVRSFALSTKKGKETWVEPFVDKVNKSVRFEIKTGKGKPLVGTVNRRGARCICCGAAVSLDFIRSEGQARRIGCQLIAIIAGGDRRRIYVNPDDMHVKVANQAKPSWKPDAELPHNPRDFKTPNYGMKTFGDIFTSRQLVALTTFSDLVGEARELALQDAKAKGMRDDAIRLNDGGNGATAYSDAVGTYLGLCVSKFADFSTSLNTWNTTNQNLRNLFARQAIPMAWDFVENNMISGIVQFERLIHNLAELLVKSRPAEQACCITQHDARDLLSESKHVIITDPPYYDNIGYADLSDFFYIWLRRSIGDMYQNIFSTMQVPKAPELVATPYRFGGDKAKAQQYFETGLGQAFISMHRQAHLEFPLIIYYAFKQSENEELDDVEDEDNYDTAVSSTGWETMLNGLLQAGFVIVGTWPMRSERASRMIAMGTNALASSIVLVCRSRPTDAPTATRKEFLSALRRELAPALKELQQGSIAAVDLAQAAIGPGMAVFSRYASVLEANGQAMPVRTALQIINQELDEWLKGQEGILDPDTRFCVAWYETFGMAEAAFGEANTLAQAKNTVVQRLDDAGLLSASKGKVRLLTRQELSDKWSPIPSSPIWLCTQHLVRALAEGGEVRAAELANRMGGHLAEASRSLAYRLYAVAERKGWTEDALAYNSLAASWSDVQAKAAAAAGRPKIMDNLF